MVIVSTMFYGIMFSTLDSEFKDPSSKTGDILFFLIVGLAVDKKHLFTMNQLCCRFSYIHFPLIAPTCSTKCYNIILVFFFKVLRTVKL